MTELLADRPLGTSVMEIKLVRVIRLRPDEAAFLPGSVMVNAVFQTEDGSRELFGQADLRDGLKPVLLPTFVWETAERLADRLIGVKVNSENANAEFESALEDVSKEFSQELEERGTRVFDLVMAAFAQVFGAISGQESAEQSAESTPASRPNFVDIQEFYRKSFERISKYAVSPAPAAPIYNGVAANVFSDAAAIEPLPKDGTKGFLLEREALRYGMSSTRFPGGAFVVADPTGHRLGFKWGRSPLASGVALSICSYKEATRRLLERVDVPVPQGRVFSIEDRANAIAYADRIGYPVVCKPVAGLRGIGVVAGIQSQAELSKALDLYEQSEMGTDDFVIEEHVPGEDYRIVVIGGEVVASVVRAPASVVGDGFHTIADLIAYKNRARKENPHLSSRPIRFGGSLKYQLSFAGLDFGSIPAPGQQVILANSANLSQGGDSFEITDELHPSIKELAVKAVNAVPGLGFCGLDMLIEDHHKPIWEQRVTVIELNAHAAIGSAQYPMWGTPAPVARKFFEETAKAAGVSLPEKQANTLALRINIRGHVTRVGYRRWMQRRADAYGLTGYVRNVSEREVEAHVFGAADEASALAYLAMDGPDRAVPTSVTVTQCPYQERDTFEILNS